MCSHEDFVGGGGPGLSMNICSHRRRSKFKVGGPNH